MFGVIRITNMSPVMSVSVSVSLLCLKGETNESESSMFLSRLCFQLQLGPKCVPAHSPMHVHINTISPSGGVYTLACFDLGFPQAFGLLN